MIKTLRKVSKPNDQGTKRGREEGERCGSARHVRDTRVSGTQIDTDDGPEIVILVDFGVGTDGHKGKDGEDDERHEGERSHGPPQDGR